MGFKFIVMPEESKKLQNVLFRCGYSWCGEKSNKFTHYPFLYIHDKKEYKGIHRIYFSDSIESYIEDSEKLITTDFLKLFNDDGSIDKGFKNYYVVFSGAISASCDIPDEIITKYLIKNSCRGIMIYGDTVILTPDHLQLLKNYKLEEEKKLLPVNENCLFKSVLVSDDNEKWEDKILGGYHYRPYCDDYIYHVLEGKAPSDQTIQTLSMVMKMPDLAKGKIMIDYVMTKKEALSLFTESTLAGRISFTTSFWDCDIGGVPVRDYKFRDDDK